MGSVLITGGAGFFGRACVEKLLRDGLSDRVCIYSRDEYKHALMRDQFGDDPRLRWFVGDVRDRDRLRRALRGVDTVIHAAALKRIEVGAYCPDEMVQTNILGTMRLLDAAEDRGVQRLVMLSTDKAWQPVSPYGQSKALAESLVLAANGHGGLRTAVVRYGNVVGSTGSCIPRWRALRAAGGAITMTDPECTRFWMRADEAVALVLGTLQNMQGGERVIPEDLPAFRLGDLADAMGVTARITGLPAHEKLHEGLCDGITSDRARRMSVAEIREALAYV